MCSLLSGHLTGALKPWCADLVIQVRRNTFRRTERGEVGGAFLFSCKAWQTYDAVSEAKVFSFIVGLLRMPAGELELLSGEYSTSAGLSEKLFHLLPP